MSVQKKVVSIVLNDFTHDSRVLKECNSLLANTYQVRVAAMHSSGLAEKENKDGLEIRRYPISTQKLSNGLIFSGIKYIHLLWKIYRDNRDADIFHCNDIEALPIGVFAKWMGRGKKVVYDAHEYESEKGGVSSFRKKILFIFERFFIKYADKVITVGEQIGIEYSKLFNIEKPAIVMNCPVLSPKTFDKTLLRKHFAIEDDKVLLILQGVLTADRGIQEILDAFVNVNRSDMALVFMGYGSMADQVKTYAAIHSNIFFMPPVPPEMVVNYTASADLGLIFTENSCLSHYYSMPNKFFEYIHADLAILSWPLYEIKKIVEVNKIGIITQDFTTDAIQSVLEKLNKDDIKKYKENIKNLKYKYNWQAQELILLDVYKSLYL